MKPPLNVSILGTYIMNNRCEHLYHSREGYSQITLPTNRLDYLIAGQVVTYTTAMIITHQKSLGFVNHKCSLLLSHKLI